MHHQERSGNSNVKCQKYVTYVFIPQILIFSCEEAALEGQMLSVCVCLFDCLTPKLNITKVMLFEVYTNQLTVQGYTKPVYCTSDSTRVHKTSLNSTLQYSTVHHSTAVLCSVHVHSTSMLMVMFCPCTFLNLGNVPSLYIP